ncbi:tannase/feruloyl esterase family alpha/beta hydrolase [Planctomycetota bacterium]
MRSRIFIIVIFTLVIFSIPNTLLGADAIPAPGTRMAPAGANIVITAEDVTVEKVGTSIPVSEIGEPVSAVNLSEPQWVSGADAASSYAVVEGSMMPVDPDGFPINFRVILPAIWSRRAIQQGGGGNNGTITVQAGGGRGGRGGGGTSNQGIARYGSDSGHQAGGGMAGRGGRSGQQTGGSNSGDAWALNDEAIKNLGYMQMKKTHDAAMVIMERVYGERPRFNYYIGTSQGGREALTVAQRYPQDYDGIVSNVPIVNFSSLMMAPEFIRIQEKKLENWVTPQKTTAIATEFIRRVQDFIQVILSTHRISSQTQRLQLNLSGRLTSLMVWPMVLSVIT